MIPDPADTGHREQKGNVPMKILVHDFAGHPFQTELSRELARRGHDITHGWFAGDIGPKGPLQDLPGDPATLDFHPFGAGIDYSKEDFIKRFQGDRAYGREVGAWIEAERPDLVIAGNTPADAVTGLMSACEKHAIPFVYWCQDFYSIAVSKVFEKKLPVIGSLIGSRYRHLDKSHMARSAHVVHITEQFCEQTDHWGIPRDKVSVIPNWGAIREIDRLDRDTGWARDQGLSEEGTRFIYSGTLALKHNPELLAALSRRVEGSADEVVVIAAGVGADRLDAQKARGELPRMRRLPLQPFDVFPQVLGAGDVLMAVIERDAGIYSVPSKVLSYLCAGRPIVMAAPPENLAARIVAETGAGKVVDPEDVEGFVAAAMTFRNDPAAAAAAGDAGRRYAEENFEIDRVADRFEAVFEAATAGDKVFA